MKWPTLTPVQIGAIACVVVLLLVVKVLVCAYFSERCDKRWVLGAALRVLACTQVPAMLKPLLLIVAGLSLAGVKYLLFKNDPMYVSGVPFKRTRKLLQSQLRAMTKKQE